MERFPCNTTEPEPWIPPARFYPTRLRAGAPRKCRRCQRDLPPGLKRQTCVRPCSPAPAPAPARIPLALGEDNLLAELERELDAQAA